MSRIGKKIILLPKKICFLKKKKYIILKGVLGKLKLKINKKILIKKKKNNIILFDNYKNKVTKSLHGLYRTLIYNMICGVSVGFIKTLIIIGLEYKVVKYSNFLEFNLGYSHNILIDIPKCIKVKIKNINNNFHINFFSYNNVILGLYCAIIKNFRKPDVYKGKGIRYLNEKIIKKNKKKI
ncbi:MAG: 50S ribosomal protein L6 [Candidatus Shikimatogenerans sp. Ttur]|uniref:50S ribosomal protein L6 n=1 Tax=Candidatus Shikimatogenerans sp. Ttur TaxID=3158569 RepID=A0AAU7ZXD2_9FLAO